MAPRRSRILSLTLVTALLGSGCAYLRNGQSELEEAESALEAGDTARAEAIYRETMANKRSADRDEARALLINLLLGRGAELIASEQDRDTAMGAYREALDLDPTRDESRIAYARALMKLERYTEAVDVLMAGQGCRGCKSLISVIYLERGNAEVRDGEFADALADYDLALNMNRDPMTVLAKVAVYTVGDYGTGAEAVDYLDHAQRLLPIDQAGVQQLWWDQRVAVVYKATLAGETAAVDRALAMEDPRRTIDAKRRTLERLNLHMYVASLQIFAKAYEAGTDRGLRTYAEADGAIAADELAKLRETLLGLFMQRVATHLAEDDDVAARAALVQALEIDPQNRILAFQDVLATAARNTGNARKLLGEHAGDPEQDRMKALVETIYARKMMGIGQFSAARGAVEKAERYAPDLLETHLVRAELEVETRFEGLKKTWAEQFREIDTFDYPGGRINNYGRALAELRLVQARFDDAAARDYLRAPAVAARIAALEARIKGFYPYDAALAGPEQAGQAILRFVREEDGEFEVRVQGPKGEQLVVVPGGSQAELVLAGPGLAVVNAPTGRKALFAEPGVVVVLAI